MIWIVSAVGIDHLALDLEHWIERVHRTLRNIGDRAEPLLEHLLITKLQQIHSINDNGASFDLPRRLDHPHHGQAHRTLPRAGFPYQTEFLALFELQVHLVQCNGSTDIRVVADRQA